MDEAARAAARRVRRRRRAQVRASRSRILRVETFLGVFIGAVTFTGSVIAFGKLAGKVDGKAKKLPGGHLLNAGAAAISLVLLVVYLQTGSSLALIGMTAAALFIGYHLIMGIGGADMPVVVSMLNSYSGWAAAAIGFSLSNDLLIVVGALVGSSGAILSYIMCKAMNRQLHQRDPGRLRQHDRPGDGGRGRADRHRRRRRGGGAERCRQRHHHPGLRHGGGAGAAVGRRN